MLMRLDERILDVTCEECNTGFKMIFTDTDEGGMSIVACPFCAAELAEEDYIEVDDSGEIDEWDES